MESTNFPDTFRDVRNDSCETAIFYDIVDTLRFLRTNYSAEDVADNLTDKPYHILSFHHYDSILEAAEPLLSGYHTYQDLAHAILDNIELY